MERRAARMMKKAAAFRTFSKWTKIYPWKKNNIFRINVIFQPRHFSK
jgi:hypothetical protein